MSLLLIYRKLGHECRLRIDSPTLEPLARCLQSSSLIREETCSSSTPADLAWVGSSAPDRHLLLHGQPWPVAPLTASQLYLQTDHLLDHLPRQVSPQSVFLHAGAVVAPTGQALLICGSSGAGKTSLVTACLAQGWAWLSDELLAFPGPLWHSMHGAKRNFNLKARSFSHFPQTASAPGTFELPLPDSRQRIRFFNPDALHPGLHRPTAPLRALIFPQFSPTAPLPPSPLSQAETASRLASELLSRHPHAFAWLASASRLAPSFLLPYHHPRDAVPVLADLAQQLAPLP